ncbi:MAG: GspH/FimT family pseudopilin [Sedimentisphaerales bacterium]|nr:GspH/FimT family pseudopilin [Sedimentisphaerales bacterium]
MFMSEISKINSFSLALRKGKTFALHTASGFTLIEIIIVVVILSIAAMAAIPLMSSASDVQIRSASNLIAADLEYAKSMAISRGQNYSVVFDGSNNSYGIYKEGESDPIPHPVKKGFDYVMNFTNDSRLGKVDITNVNFDSTSTVEFDCLGSPVDLNNTGTITISANGITAIISVEPVTGYISISL